MNNSKKQALDRMKFLCLGVLIFCVVVCIFIHKIYPENPGLAWVFVKGLFEAAVVGAMADWYAVVALFRYPMGVKLPHTAIIQKQKDSIGENLGEFVKNEFMKDEDVVRKIKDFDPIKKFFHFLEEREKKYFFSVFMGKALSAIVSDKGVSYITHFFGKKIASLFDRLDAADGAARLLEVLYKNGMTEKVMDECLDKALQHIEIHKSDWIKRASDQGFFKGNFIGVHYVEGAIDEAVGYLKNLKDPMSNDRKKVNDQIVLYVYELKNNKELNDVIESYKLKFVQSDEFNKVVEHGFEYLKKMLVDDLDRGPQSNVVGYIHGALATLIKKYEVDSEFNDYLNRIFEKIVRYLLARKNLIAQYLAEQVKKWESEDIANKLELEIGKDLQYIRLSGTVVGGLVGGLFSVLLRFI